MDKGRFVAEDGSEMMGINHCRRCLIRQCDSEGEKLWLPAFMYKYVICWSINSLEKKWAPT